MIWVACPICNETWSEEVPDIGQRTEDLTEAIRSELVFGARRHKEKEHDVLAIMVGVVE